VPKHENNILLQKKMYNQYETANYFLSNVPMPGAHSTWAWGTLDQLCNKFVWVVQLLTLIMFQFAYPHCL